VVGACPVTHDDDVVPPPELAQQVAQRAVRQPAPDHDAGTDIGRSGGAHVPSPEWLRGRHVSDTRATAMREDPAVTYVIAEPCVDVKDKACIEECPVDCIYEGKRSLYIHPDECVDCGACEPVCPVEAIFYEDDTPAQWKDYYRANVDFFTETTTIGSPGGASKVGPVDLDHPVVMAVPLGKNTEGH
jgi:NAD-dependent dihydropyrimidine dehydrogenase PreA subunit